MSKYFSDYFPPALVRDLRRSLRTRGYLVMLALALLAAVWVQYAATQEEDGGGVATSIELLLIAMVLMWGVIPNRAGASVSADAKVKGTNFMMLTPLTSRQIVWGTWVSACFQLLLVAGVGALITWWHLSTETTLTMLNPNELASGLAGEVTRTLRIQQQWTIYGLVVAVGVIMIAVFMFLAQLSRFFRLAVGALVLLSVFVWFTETFITAEWFTQENYDPVGEFLKGFAGASLLLRVINALIFLVALLELARRSYAAPAENCSRAVRVISLLPLAIAPVVYRFAPELLEEQILVSVMFAFFVNMSDALLPTYSLPAHNKRVWPVLPAYLQVPGIGQAAFFTVLSMLLCVGVLWGLHNGERAPGYIAEFFLSVLRLQYVVLIALFLTDLMCKRTNVNRPIVCGVIFVALNMLGGALWVVCFSKANIFVQSILPVLGFPDAVSTWEITSELIMALSISGCCVLVMLLLLMWRGRRA